MVVHVTRRPRLKEPRALTVGQREGGTNCSSPGASAPVSAGEGARTASSAGAHGTSVRIASGKPVAGTEGDEDPVGTYTSKFTTRNRAIVEA
jgi:hypothetical protein